MNGQSIPILEKFELVGMKGMMMFRTLNIVGKRKTVRQFVSIFLCLYGNAVCLCIVYISTRAYGYFLQ